jgi:SAM-dependent methyltransferase
MIAEAVREALRIAPRPGAALEVGCEGGRWSRLLADHGWSVTCTDVDAAALEICKGRIPEATSVLVEKDGQNLPGSSASANLILCLEVFPVIESDWFLPEAARVLSDRGLLVGVTLNRMSFRGVVVRTKQFLRPIHHAHYRRSYSVWRNQARAEGFTLLYERGFCWFPLARTSNSVLAPFFAGLERLLGLSRVPVLSPWVVFIARKR